MFNIKKFLNGLKLLPKTTLDLDSKGEIQVSDSDNKAHYHDGTTSSPIVTEDHSSTLTNKTIDSADNTITVDADEAAVSNLETDNLKTGVLNTSTTLATASDTQIPSALAVKTYVDDSVAGKDEASEITYDNTTSGLTATDVQAAVDEVEGRLDTAETNIGNNATAISDHLSDAVDAHDASAISNVPTGNLAATTVQGAVDELQGDIDTINTNVGNNATAISDHLSDTVDAHDASAISSVASGNLAATDVQGALNELQSDIDTRALASDLSNHINDVADAHAASAITNTPSGNLAATDLQSAVDELQSDIDTRALDSDLTTHISDTSTHGVSGDLVGTSDTQTLTNKTIQGASIETPSRLDVKQDTLANLTTYASSAANGQICFATDTKQMFQVIDAALAPIGGGVSDVDILEVIESFDTSDGLTTLTSGIHGQTFRLTHDASVLKYAEKDIALDDKFRNKQLQLLVDLKTTAASGNFKVVITDVTNGKTLADEILTPQDTGALTSKRSVTFSTTPADGDLAIATINVQFEALAESGSPTSDFDDIVVQLAKTEVREIIAIEQEENEFSARIANNGTATITSQNYPFIESVSRTAAGLVLITFKSSFFTVAPSVTASPRSGSNVYATIESAPTASSFSVQIRNDAGTPVDSDIMITVSRQGSDYRNLTRRVEREISTFKEVIVEENDSMIRLNTGNGFGATNIYVRRFLNLEQSIGSDIEYQDSATLGASFIPKVDGVYSISYTDQASGGSGTMGITKNSVDQVNGSLSPDQRLAMASYDATNGDYETVTWIGYLTTNDIIRATLTSAQSASTRTSFTMSRQGSLTKAQVAPDSKIEIPTSELRFEGSSSRGGTDTAIVKFDTLAKIRGDAFSVVNTAANGTVITMNKAGRLTTSGVLFLNAASAYVIVTKNQANLAALPLASEMVAEGYLNATNSMYSLAGTTDVEAGDVIRIYSQANPGATSPGNTFHLFFQEQKIAVAISNITPQYEDVDSMVRVNTGNGHGSTNTAIRRFSDVVENLGSDITYTDSAIEGAKFTIETDGFYSISYSDMRSSSAADFGISKNSTQLTIGITLISKNNRLATTTTGTGGYEGNVSWSGYLFSGDIIRPHTDTTPQSVDEATFTISKVGVPSIAEVDVTPFADVNRRVTAKARFSGFSARNSGLILFGSVNELEGNGLLSHTRTDHDRITFLKECNVNISLGAYQPSSTTDVSINIYDSSGNIKLAPNESAHTSNARVAISTSYIAQAGDYVIISSSGDLGTSAAETSFSIVAEADSRTTMYSVAQTENEFSARISNNGTTAAIVSESSSFIDSVTRTGLGRVSVLFKSGFFSQAPSVSLGLDGGDDDYNIHFVSSPTTLGFEIIVRNSGAQSDQNFQFITSRQGADRQDLQKAIVQLNEFPRVNKVISQHISHNSAGSTLTERNTEVEFNLSNVVNSGSSIISIVDDSANTRTKFIALKDCRVNLSFNARVANAGGYQTVVYVNGNLVQRGNNSSGAGSSAYVSYSGRLNKDDYITVGIFVDTVENSAELCQLNILAEAEDLEVITNVDAHENEFSARIANNGTATITSQNYDFIDSVSRTAPGRVTINFKPGFFTEIPAISGSVVDTAAFGNYLIEFDSASTSSVLVRTFNTAASVVDVKFDIKVSRQGADHKSIQDVVAQVFTPKIAYLKDVKPVSTDAGGYTVGSWVTRDLNTVEGDSEIVSLSANIFTLLPGKYTIEAESTAFRTDVNIIKLVRDPSGVPVDEIIGKANYSSATADTHSSPTLIGSVTLTQSTEFNIQFRGNASKSVNGLGSQHPFGDNVYTQVKITKIY